MSQEDSNAIPNTHLNNLLSSNETLPQDFLAGDGISAITVDRRIILAGRNQSGSLNVYVLSNDKFKKYASFPDIPHASRIRFSNVACLHKKLYVSVSFTGGDGFFYSCIFVTITNDGSNEWKSLNKRGIALGRHNINTQDFVDKIVVVDNYLYTFGSSAMRYNILEDKWHALPPMPVHRFLHNVVMCSNGVYLVGGKENETSKHISSFDFFDFRTQKWKIVGALPPIPQLRICSAAVVVNGRYIVVIGGMNEKLDEMANCQIFDTFTNFWHISEKNMVIARVCCGAIAVNGYDPQLTVFGGHQNHRNVEKISFYSLQPDLLPSWRPELHNYYCAQTKSTVMIMLQATQRGDLPIPKEILICHIFSFAYCPRDHRRYPPIQTLLRDSD